MKIGILGVGGVGSLIATRLSLSNNEIFCFGSKESNLSVKSNGISMESSLYGNTKVFPNDYINLKDKLDILFITVKGTRLISALNKYRNYFNENTVAISLLNGLGHKERIRKEFKIKLIVASIGSLEVSLNSKRIAIHKTKSKPFVEMSSNDKNINETMIILKNLLNSISINSEILEDENNIIWRKLRRLSVISTITSMQNKTIGYVRDDKELRKMMLALINEICSISEKVDIKTNEKDVLEAIENLPYDLKTSMQKDIYSGKPSEIEYILKAPLMYGNQLGLELPNMHYCYKFLKTIVNKGDNKKSL